MMIGANSRVLSIFPIYPSTRRSIAPTNSANDGRSSGSSADAWRIKASKKARSPPVARSAI